MSYIDEASDILDSVRGRPQSIPERRRLAIDLAALMIKEANKIMTPYEKKVQAQLARLMQDPVGKSFTTAMTDECFRSQKHYRIADQMIHLLGKFGVPKYLPWLRRLQLKIFKMLGVRIASWLIPIAMNSLRKETSRVILPGEPDLLKRHLQERKKEHIRLNLNHLGEAILSEAEAQKRLQIYLHDMKNPLIDYMSVKISTIFSQIHLLSYDETVRTLSERLKELYRAAMASGGKFINLDMEEYRDLDLTVRVFQEVLDEPEFQSYPAGIVLQAYLPDSHMIQRQLTEWAKERVRQGGAPIKIRIVKGANLAMEQFEASLKGWPQAPYMTKVEVDANYKRMVMYGMMPDHARAVHLGVASHNLFDIAFAMLLRVENEVEPYVCFEMLEGMADHIRRVVQSLTGDMLLYCPIATREEFQHAIAYLIRRLDENTGPENFLRHAFGLEPGTESWESQAHLFSQSLHEIEATSLEARRTQNRQKEPVHLDAKVPFDNEPDTDFSLAANRAWAGQLLAAWTELKPDDVPLVIAGEERFPNRDGVGEDPSVPGRALYRFAKATKEDINDALSYAKAHEKEWRQTTVARRSELLARVARLLRERRGDLIGSMIIDGGKTILEADPEVSEAIDFAEYYRRQAEKMAAMKDIRWTPKGTVLVASPWNFPAAIPLGGILAALVCGNCVIFKPASDAVLVGWHIANAVWDAGISKQTLQFVPCSGEEAGRYLISDPRVNSVILTGGTETAKRMMQMRPGLDLAAETGGKNSIIVTDMADRDLAIKDILQSAFGHAGQKCSATSLAILEGPVYDDPHFIEGLVQAASSLKVGSAHDPTTKIGPLIRKPAGALLQGLTALEDGEEWVLQPRVDSHNPRLWTPGIKRGTKPGGFTHMTELFGPVLTLMRARDLHEALHIANMVPYGLTAGLQSLDEREQAIWLKEMEAGNLYVNRTTTGAIVRRQPFGGTKASQFGNGSKAGGPNYLREFMQSEQVGLPQEKVPVNEWVNSLTVFLEKLDLDAERLGLWTASIANYAYWWKRMKQERDPTKIIGQDNFFRYVPRKHITFRMGSNADAFDALRVAAAALTTGAEMEISWTMYPERAGQFNWLELVPALKVIAESDAEFLHRVAMRRMERVRLVEPASAELKKTAAHAAVHLIDAPVL
ncbi:MAG: putative proline dehydrogenase/delta-pyrroline-5-carboxylate dehydrogenase, partial [Chlamydiota bacterium]